MMYVTTQSGAIYSIISQNGSTYAMRATLDGDDRDLTHKDLVYHKVASLPQPSVGSPMVIEWADGRVRVTTTVVQIEEVPSE